MSCSIKADSLQNDLGYLYSSGCLSCGAFVSEDRQICKACEDRLAEDQKCHTILSIEYVYGGRYALVCGEARKIFPSFDAAMDALETKGGLSGLIADMTLKSAHRDELITEEAE